MAIPGSIHNTQAKGCHYLLQQGARLVESTADVLDALSLNNDAVDLTYMQSTLAIEKGNLVKCIGYEITTIDQIVRRSNLCVEEVICGVSELELQGTIKSVPGGYMRCRK